MPNNNRVFWAIEQVAIKDNAAPPTGEVAGPRAVEYSDGVFADAADEVVGRWEVPRGLQSIGMSTTFNLEQVFQLGQVELYEYSERQPDIEVTMSKAIDGTKPLFFMVTDPSQANDIVARTNQYRCDVALQIYPDSQFRATSKPQSIVTASGMYVSNISYTFPVDGFVTEDVTLVGNDKIWGSVVDGEVTWPDDALGEYDDLSAVNPNAPEGMPSGVFGYDGLTSQPSGGLFEQAGGSSRFGVLVVGSGIQRREEVDIRRSILPNDIPGITAAVVSGIDGAYVNGGNGEGGPGTALNQDQLIADANTDSIAEHVQNITVSFSIAREDIFELGSKRPFVKVPDFPLEATASIEVITAAGDLVDATSDIDCGPDNTTESNTIIIRTCDGLQVDLGDSNRLTSVEQGGGEAGGDNMTVTYNYSSFNVFNVSHDFYQPNHRVLVFETGNSRFNVGGTSYLRSQFGIW